MPFAKHDDMVEALSSDGADQPLLCLPETQSASQAGRIG